MPIALFTGETGFIGLYAVKLLLEHGHRVYTTVRSLKSRTQYPEKLKLFEDDLLSDSSFTQAMQGCDIAYYIASPFLVPQHIRDGMKDCVEPALQGTRTVLDSFNQKDSVKRVVLTSSIQERHPLGDLLERNKYSQEQPIQLLQMIAEREAWKMAKAQNRWQLGAVNPGLVVGSSLLPEYASGSLYMLDAMYRGENKSGTIELHYPIADVRDVAEAHVEIGEMPAAKGRCIIAGGHSVSLLEMANFVRPFHAQPSLLPTRNLLKLMVYAVGPFMGMSMEWVSGNVGIGYKVDNSESVQDLKSAFRPTSGVLRDHYTAWASSQGSS